MNTEKLQRSVPMGWGRGKKTNGERIVQRNIPYHIISHPAINLGKEHWGFVFLYVHCSETQNPPACEKGFFAFANSPTIFHTFINYILVQVNLLSLILFCPLSCWSKWNSEHVAAVEVSSCWLGSTHHSIM